MVANGFPSRYGDGEAEGADGAPAEGAAGCRAHRLLSVAIPSSAASAALTPVHSRT